jgi:hypothetical protein
MSTRYCLTVLICFVAGWTTIGAAEPATGNKTRRVIVNDDGEVRLPLNGKDWDRYLGERVYHAVGTQVDSYFLNIAATSRQNDAEYATINRGSATGLAKFHLAQVDTCLALVTGVVADP